MRFTCCLNMGFNFTVLKMGLIFLHDVIYVLKALKPRLIIICQYFVNENVVDGYEVVRMYSFIL